MNENELLRAVYSTRLRDGTASVHALSQALRWTPEEVTLRLEEASRERLVEITGEEVSLTAAGRGRLTVVMIGGAFEIIHPRPYPHDRGGQRGWATPSSSYSLRTGRSPRTRDASRSHPRSGGSDSSRR